MPRVFLAAQSLFANGCWYESGLRKAVVVRRFGAWDGAATFHCSVGVPADESMGSRHTVLRLQSATGSPSPNGEVIYRGATPRPWLAGTLALQAIRLLEGGRPRPPLDCSTA